MRSSRILALIRKELLAVLKDPRSRFSLFLPPILQCLIFGYAATYDLNDVPYAVLDQDRSAASHELLAGSTARACFTAWPTSTVPSDIEICDRREAALCSSSRSARISSASCRPASPPTSR